MSEHPQLNLKVAYCSLRGAEATHDPEFGATIHWDVPLLDGYDWVEVPNHGSGNEGFFGLYNPGLWKLIHKGKFDAVLCFTGYIRASFWVAKFACLSSGAAMLFGTDASSLAPRDARAWKIPLKRIIWRWLFGLADQVIVPSSASAQMMRGLGLAEDRITLTPFVADNDWWSAHSTGIDRGAVRASWGVLPHQLVVLYCAKLQPWKRPTDLLRAFGKAEVDDSVLVFAGEGSLRPQLESEARQLGVASRVRFLGFKNQTELPAVYCASDLFVLPSEYDPCPVVVCEAMLCGLPVLLSSEIRGRFDLVQPGVTGDIFQCGHIDELAAVLSRLLRDRQFLATLGGNARARMVTWSPNENISAMVEAISRALQCCHRDKLPPSAGIFDITASSTGTKKR
jgi:glycosyltransferase involved in cell wall biosynthesis